jgi:hypothetical protein
LNDGEFMTRDEDLAGFWDMVCLQIEDIQRMFNQLDELKSNNWQIVNPVTIIKQVVKKSIVKKNPQSTTTTTTTNLTNNVKTVNSSTKARADAARQRLIEAKKNAALIKQQQQLEDILQAEN